jgi:hypothetical protein
VAEFYDDQQHYETGLLLPSVAPSGQHDGGSESVWDLQSRHHVVERSVFTRQPGIGGKAKPDPHFTQQAGDKGQIVLAVLHHLFTLRVFMRQLKEP